MKKFGFTISEALVTLGVIGVIAMLTMPTFISNQKTLTYTRALPIAIKNFNLAMSNMMTREAIDNLRNSRAWSVVQSDLDTSTAKANIDNFVNIIQRDLTLSHYDTTSTAYTNLSGSAITLEGSPVNFFAKNGVEYKISINRDNYADITDSNALLAGTNLTRNAATVYIDINGTAPPNILGRDLYLFELGADGILYPFGGSDLSILKGEEQENVETECKTNNNGEYCAAYLMENGYNMDY